MVKGKTHLHKYKTIGSRYQGRFPPLRLWKWKIDGNETDLCVYFNQLEQRCSTGRNSRKFKTVAQLLFLFTAICCAVSMISIYTVLTAKKIRSKEVRTNKHRKKTFRNVSRLRSPLPTSYQYSTRVVSRFPPGTCQCNLLSQYAKRKTRTSRLDS